MNESGIIPDIMVVYLVYHIYQISWLFIMYTRYHGCLLVYYFVIATVFVVRRKDGVGCHRQNGGHGTVFR